MKRLLFVVGLLLSTLVLMACGGAAEPTEPERVEVPVEVEVTRVVETIVEGTPVVETITETIIVTATPAPEPEAPEVSFDSPHPDTYIIATFGEPETLDPALDYESAGIGLIQQIYETLVTYERGDAATMVPQLAESWEISEDGTTYTFQLRDGVTFHNGNDLTASDVAYTFQRGLLQGGPSSPQLLLTEPFLGVGIYDVAELIDPALSGDPEGLAGADAAQLAQVCEDIKASVVADDDAGTVTMTLAQPWAPFLSTLAGAWSSVMDMEWTVEQGLWDGDCATWHTHYGISSEENPITALTNGTGPYFLDRWTPGEDIVLTANENYWRTEEIGPAWEGGPVGVAAIEQVIIQGVDEWGTRFAMLQAGDADTVTVPPENRTQVDPLVGEDCVYNPDTWDFDCAPTENPDGPIRRFLGLDTVTRTDALFVYTVNTEGGNQFIGSGQFDGNGVPADFFSDVNVRRGFNYCFDWEAFIQEVYQGEAYQNIGVTIPGQIGYNEDGPAYTTDLEQCEAELAQAWGGQLPETGFRLQAGYNTGNTSRQTMIEILQANLQAVNELYQVEAIGLPWPSFLRQLRESRLPLAFSGWHQDINDPHNWVQPFLVGTYAARQALPEETIAQFSELIDAAVVSTDDAERQEIYEQLNALDYEEAVGIRGVIALGRFYQQRWVQGYFFNPQYSATYYYALNEAGESE